MRKLYIGVAAAAALALGVITAFGSGGVINRLGTNQISNDGRSVYRFEASTAAGSTWASIWTEIPPGNPAAAVSYASSWNGGWRPSSPLTLPNGQASIDAYMTWHPTWNGGRFVFVLLDSAASRNVWFGYSNDSAGTSWTIRSTAALVGGFNPSTGQFFNWDYPSIGVDSGGRIIIGAVASPGTDNRFFTTVSTDNGATFSTPSPVPATFGRNARVIGANGRFHAFLPTLDPITNTINKVDRWESTNGSTWTGPNLVASFPSGPPNQSASNVSGYPVFYSPFLDARGNANGNWAVVFPANYNGYSNTYICTNFRGCGFVNQGNGDEFLAATHIASDNSIWVSYKTFANSTTLRQDAFYFPQGGATSGATVYDPINPASWYPAPSSASRCSSTCWIEGDYTHITSNPYAAASLQFISTSPLTNYLYQNFVQDPPGTGNVPQLTPNFVPFPLGSDIKGLSRPVPEKQTSSQSVAVAEHHQPEAIVTVL